MTNKLEALVLERLRQSKNDILYSMKMAGLGNPFAGEPDSERRRERLQTKVNLSVFEAKIVDAEVRRRARTKMFHRTLAGVKPENMEAQVAGEALTIPRGTQVVPPDAREKVWGDSIDFVNVAFLERGAQVARSVGRVAYKNGRARGSGVLIGEGLFLTNHHVIETALQAEQFCLEFDYERDLSGSLREPTRFTLDASFFITDPEEGLDFTIIGVGDVVNGPENLNSFGISVLSAARDKHMIGEIANIVQHPQGRFKEVVLRENRLVNRFDDCLHYVADTEPGSSGSPVYNSEWQMIALHHWGGPWIDGGNTADPQKYEINEGIRISSIIRKLKNRIRDLPSDAQRRIGNILDSEGSFVSSPRQLVSVDKRSEESTTNVNEAIIDSDGRAVWTLPIEISFRIPSLAMGSSAVTDDTIGARILSAAVVSESDDYSDREGFDPDFLDGIRVPLPELGPGIVEDAAELLASVPGTNPHELKYHHFSVVMNKRRRLAFFTACMIDGKTSKSIGRSSRKISDLKADDIGLRETIRNLSDAEADSWTNDDRLNRKDYSGEEIYKSQKIPGFPNPSSGGRIARMFQKGHLVRRLDPAWGDDSRSLEAEIDTFHWTNAAPQVGFFNQGTADEDDPGTGRGNLWRAAENYVLRNAVSENQKVISFTGPIFRDDDRAYRHIQIPAKYFKVTVWQETGSLRSLALIVDQAQVFDGWPEAIGKPEFVNNATEAEAFQDVDELNRVKDFLSTIEELEQVTELDFGELVRAADIRKGLESKEVTSDGDLPFATNNFLINNALVAPDGEPDDLTNIHGIGPRLQRLLNRQGIYHFHQIAAWGADEVAIMDKFLRFPGRIMRDNWIAQAQDLT